MPHNFTENPAQLIESVFSDIHKTQMQDLPFVNGKLSVKALDFALFEGDWLGMLLTPWTLSIMLIPGPSRHWQPRTVGDKIGLSLPSGNYNFTYGHHEELGCYLSSSVMSPVQNMTDQDSAVQLAKDLRQLLTAIPTKEVHVRNESRRALFGLKGRHSE